MKREHDGFSAKLNSRFSLKDNNSGFTLLELLIAVLILAVAMIPMLNSFVVNARVTRKAKIKLRSTMIAQDIMEGLKGYSTGDIYSQFSGQENFRFIDNPGLVDPATKKVKSSNVTIISTNDLKYTYEMKNLVYQGFDYDAKLELDGEPYKKTVSGGVTYTKVNTPKSTKIHPNSDELADLSKMDSAYDGLFMSDNEESRELILNELKDAKTNKFLADTVNRTFEITLSSNGTTVAGGKKQLAQVKVTYETVSSGSVVGKYNKTYTAYNNIDIADDGCNIRNLYFFYYPAYTGNYLVGADTVHINYNDKIIFTNYDEIPVTLYIMKQKSVNPSILADLYVKDMDYSPSVYIKEKATVSIDTKKTTVCTNLTKNLHDGSEILNKAKFYFGIGEVGVTPSQLGADKLISTRTVNRMFDAVVSVYEKGAADEGFPEEKLLTQLDSSKLN